MKHLRDIGRQSLRNELPLSNSDRYRGFLLNPIEWVLYKYLRHLKLATGHGVTKLNVWGVKHPKAYDGVVFNGVTNVELAIDWTQIAELPSSLRARTALDAYISGLVTMFRYFGLPPALYEDPLRTTLAGEMQISEELASIRVDNVAYKAYLDWKEFDDFATLKVARIQRGCDGKIITIATTWPDFDSISKKAAVFENPDCLTLNIFGEFLKDSCMGVAYISPNTNKVVMSICDVANSPFVNVKLRF